MVSNNLKQNQAGKNTELTNQVQDFCKHIAGTNQITAIALCDDLAVGIPKARTVLETLLIIRDFQPRLMSYAKVFEGRNVVVLAVDQWIFERDIERGFLGEASANTLIFPFVPVFGQNYLHTQEILLKKRLILELLENFVLNFPELCYVVHIKPKYFMYEVMLNRVRVFPPLTYGMSSFLYDSGHGKGIDQVLSGYLEALKLLGEDDKLTFSDGTVIIPKQFVTKCKNPKVRLANITKNAPRALFSSLFGIFPQLLNFLSLNTETLLKYQKFSSNLDPEERQCFVDPRKYVFVPTSEGLVSLADKVNIETYVRKMLLGTENASIKVQPIGGVLNDLYLIKAYQNGAERKILVKRFKDWSGLKWLPLTMWSTGAASFAVIARSRLERECAVNELLSRAGFNVPRILHVSHHERLVFMEYIEGEDLSNAIKRIGLLKNRDKDEKDLSTIMRVGEIYAKVHAANVALGDTKPENVIVTPKGTIYLLDLEQATPDGDKAWDVAEFLYYSGHYLPLHSDPKAESIAKSFIFGYLKAGGAPKVIEMAGAQKYTRVFSIFTLPSVVRAISKICKKGASYSS